MNLSIVLFILTVIIIIINLFVIIWSIIEYNIDSNDILQFFILLLWILADIFIIFFEYVILRKIFKAEMDFIVFNKNWINKITNSPFFWVYPYFLKADNIWNISIKSNYILKYLFNVWNIKITWFQTKYYKYIKDPEKIYEILLKLTEGNK